MVKINATNGFIRENIAVLLTHFRAEVAGQVVADRRLAVIRRACVHAHEMAADNMRASRRARRADRAEYWAGLALHWRAVARALQTADDGWRAAA